MIGLLPCAGKAQRIHGLPKALLPIDDSFLLDIHCNEMLTAGCRQVMIGTNHQNDRMIMNYLPSANCETYQALRYDTMSQTVMSLMSQVSYQTQRSPFEEDTIMFGMPDCYFESDNVYSRLARCIKDGADVAAGLFKARPGQHISVGMVEVQGGRILNVIDKSERSKGLTWFWGALAWKPSFWKHIRADDAHVGFALPRAIEAGMDVLAVYNTGGYWDCGTACEYFECIRSIE